MKSLEIPCAGYSIAADYYESDSDNIVLVLVGYMSKKSGYKDLVSAIVEQSGYSALVIDYTGHGESPFDIEDIATAQNFLEVITAYDWIKENYPKKEISIIGGSYGGYFAALLTKYRKPKNLVLQAPAMYPPEDFYTKWQNIDRSKYMDYRNNKAEVVKHPLFAETSKFEGDTLVVVHELDDVCPRPTTDTYTDMFGADKWIVKDFQHSMKMSNISKDQVEEYQSKIATWLKAH